VPISNELPSSWWSPEIGLHLLLHAHIRAGGAIGVQMKSLLFVLVKSHNLVFSGLLILAKLKQTSKKSTIKGTNFFYF
jgi:hypothetical protein